MLIRREKIRTKKRNEKNKVEKFKPLINGDPFFERSPYRYNLNHFAIVVVIVAID